MNFENLVCLVHELGHIIHFYTTINKPKNFSRIILDNFIEVPSSTLETLFIYYLIQNKIESKYAHMILKNNLFNLKVYLTSLRINNFIVDSIKNTQEVEIDYLNKLLLSKGVVMDDEEISNVFSTIPLNYGYSYGGLLGFYYLDLFKKDPEKTKRYIHDFINSIGMQPDYYMLEHFGIDKNEFISCKYLKGIVEENKKQLEYYKR